MKKIIVLTATRAEYGLLAPIIKKLKGEESIQVKVAVTGTHLSQEFGMTYREIEEDGVVIDKKIEILMSSDTKISVSKSMGLAMISFAEYFEEESPDALLVLGDRYETLAVCCAAFNFNIPIIHLYGGETTEGAIDEAIRHSITKMSFLHLTSTETYRKRVIQLGESPERVFCVGAMGVENALNSKLLSKEELFKSLDLPVKNNYAVVTYHPVTLDSGEIEKTVNEFFYALDKNNDLFYIITNANADAGGRIINEMIKKYAQSHNNVATFKSLGMRRYLSAVKYSRMVIGNSSSGLVEIPSFGIPTVNIGQRQQGRIKAESIIDCREDSSSINKAILFAKTKDFQQICKKVTNPYEQNNTSDKIVRLIKEFFITEKIDLKKRFYDIDFQV